MIEEVLNSILSSGEWRKNEPLKAHTTFHIGGPAKYYVVPDSIEKFTKVYRYLVKEKIHFYVLGKGSNVLFADEGFDGVVLELGAKLSEVIWEDDRTVSAMAGISMTSLAKTLAGSSLTGFEFASGIPGTLGGGIAMNAGAYGGEIKDCIVSATVLDNKGELKTLSKDELMLGYRTSIIQKEQYVVLSAVLRFEPGDKETIQETMKDLNMKRREKQPLEYPSAGSTFKRPEGHFAGKLIQDAGLRGYSVGDAEVSEKHCGFVVNKGNATAAEVLQLIEDVQKKVKAEFDVMLEPEVRLIR